MIRIINISRISLLSGRTNVYNLTKTCETLNVQPDLRMGLVTTDQPNDIGVFFRNMGVRRPFPVTCLGVTDTSSDRNGRLRYFLMFFWVNLRLSFFLLRRVRKFELIYLRDEFLFPTVLFMRFIFRKKVFFEIHSVLANRYKQKLNISMARLADGIIAISSGLARYYQKTNNNVLLSLCSAAEDSWFDYSRTKSDLRSELGLPQDAFLVVYTGVTGANPNNDYYELDDIVRSLPALPAAVKCVIVGEINNSADWLREIAGDLDVAERVIIRPWQERKAIPKYLQACDAILIPKRKRDLVGDSPAKMFPALAARRPIIAGHAECIEEVLTDGKDALIVEQNSPEGWTKAILKIYHDGDLAEKISSQAQLARNKYTWEKRGVSIAEFIRRSLN